MVSTHPRIRVRRSFKDGGFLRVEMADPLTVRFDGQQ